MRKKIQRKVKETVGFTLIELIVVIAVLGILALIAVPRLAGFTDTANTAKNDASAAIVYKAWQTFEAAHAGTNPTLAELNTYLSPNNQLTTLPGFTEESTIPAYITSLTLSGGGVFPKPTT